MRVWSQPLGAFEYGEFGRGFLSVQFWASPKESLVSQTRERSGTPALPPRKQEGSEFRGCKQRQILPTDRRKRSVSQDSSFLRCVELKFLHIVAQYKNGTLKREGAKVSPLWIRIKQANRSPTKEDSYIRYDASPRPLNITPHRYIY